MRKKTSRRPPTGKIGITVPPKRNPGQAIGPDFLSGITAADLMAVAVMDTAGISARNEEKSNPIVSHRFS
jgi:hypothetical protein